MLPDFLFVGNALFLDFVNTEIVLGGERVDLVTDFDALLAWFVAAGVAAPGDVAGVAERLRGTVGADEMLVRARRFRGVLRAMSERLAAGRPVPAAALDAINAAQARYVAGVTLVREKTGFRKRVERCIEGPEDLLVPVAESASDLLSGGDLSLVKQCQNPACILFFYDTTKNHTRRWCSMDVCGNRQKVAAYNRRHRHSR